MTKPVVAAKEPSTLDLKPGTYWWCRCGLSHKQPFCDGAHKDTNLVPERFVISESGPVALCMCKQTEDPPFCDGSHSNL